MKKTVFLFFLISVSLFSETITFKELTKLASEDLGTNIYLDKDVKDYSVEFNIADHQKEGEIYEFYKIVLFEHDLFLQYNKKGHFYFIKQHNKVVEPIVLDPEPIPYEDDIKYYHAYKIKNITNKDVVKVMSIFDNIKYTYLEQSDMIAYACTDRIHSQIKSMLNASDNTVRSEKIKITLFTTNKSKILSYGSQIKEFNYMNNSKFDGLFSALKRGGSSNFVVSDVFSLGLTLTALSSRGLADIKQEPIVLVTNGVRSQTDLVKNISYKVSSITYQDNTSTTTDQVEYRDIGFKLSILPKIKDNWVYLDMNLISEELLTSDDNQLPVTQKISYKNSVKVYKGKPVLLTGLKKSSEKIERGGVPVLKDLPFIGHLFKNKLSQLDEQNINIMIEVL